MAYDELPEWEAFRFSYEITVGGSNHLCMAVRGIHPAEDIDDTRSESRYIMYAYTFPTEVVESEQIGITKRNCKVQNPR
jgi:hypothetical protein